MVKLAEHQKRDEAIKKLIAENPNLKPILVSRIHDRGFWEFINHLKKQENGKVV